MPSMPSENAKYKPSPDTVAQRFPDEVVLVHLKTSRILVLNGSAARFWELLCAGKSLREILEQMLGEFEVSEPQLSENMTQLMNSLEQEKLIEPYAP